MNIRYYDSLDPKKVVVKSGITELWMNWKISNFEYLMWLNALAGRSYNDLSQYPVFPWVILDHQSEKIGLNSYRDLTKNMGSLVNR